MVFSSCTSSFSDKSGTLEQKILCRSYPKIHGYVPDNGVPTSSFNLIEFALVSQSTILLTHAAIVMNFITCFEFADDVKSLI